MTFISMQSLGNFNSHSVHTRKKSIVTVCFSFFSPFSESPKEIKSDPPKLSASSLMDVVGLELVAVVLAVAILTEERALPRALVVCGREPGAGPRSSRDVEERVNEPWFSTNELPRTRPSSDDRLADMSCFVLALGMTFADALPGLNFELGEGVLSAPPSPPLGVPGRGRNLRLGVPNRLVLVPPIALNIVPRAPAWCSGENRLCSGRFQPTAPSVRWLFRPCLLQPGWRFRSLQTHHLPHQLQHLLRSHLTPAGCAHRDSLKRALE